MIVVDTNVLAYLLIEGTSTEAARQVWIKDSVWLLPTLWRAEFLNVLRTAYRAALLTEVQGLMIWDYAVHRIAPVEWTPQGDEVFLTAARYDISAYDAQFVLAAEAHDLRLVTEDRRLRENCPTLAMSMEDFITSAERRL